MAEYYNIFPENVLMDLQHDGKIDNFPQMFKYMLGGRGCSEIHIVGGKRAMLKSPTSHLNKRKVGSEGVK